MIESLTASIVTSLLSQLVSSWKWYRSREVVDFVVEDADGVKIGIEIFRYAPTDRHIARLSDRLRGLDQKLDKILLVTPDEPDEKTRDSVVLALATPEMDVSLIALNELPSIIGVPEFGDLKLPKSISSLQTAAVTANIFRYSPEVVGPEPGLRTSSGSRRTRSKKQEAIAPEFQSMTRQFSYETISKLSASQDDLSQALGIGNKIDDVTVVLSDIKNFSSLVKASRSEDLNDLMVKYYSRARDLVWQHGGTLDKFIGDATLAIFGYPFARQDAPVDALKFSKDLIELGAELLGELKRLINESIETGTRVGVATGDVWVLDLGSGAIEVSFVGDVINLAARLEKECLTNGALLDNRTRTRALMANPAFLDNLGLSDLELSVDQAKGQIFPIRVWQMPPVIQPI